MNHEIRRQMREDFTTMSRRSFEDYALAFGYYGKEYALQGKKILDVGAGYSDFAEEAEKYGAKVTRIDPGYAAIPPEEPPLSHKKNASAAVAQELPFKDESFDEVLVSYALGGIITKTDLAIQEAVRVTKPDGLIKIYPGKLGNVLAGEVKLDPPCIERKMLSDPMYGWSPCLVIKKTPELNLDPLLTQVRNAND